MNTTAIRDDWVGRTIGGRFPLVQWLGRSDETAVFLTELPEDGTQKAAIKLIPAEGEDAKNRIDGWAATKNLSHPHLMRLLHTGQCEIDAVPLLYVVMDYADEDLSQILPERPLTPAEAGEMLTPVLDALAYLHGKGFLHSRLRPSNILVVGDQVKLSGDRILAAGKPRTNPSALSVYDAPERATGSVSEAADIWSLGITLCEALTQQPPLWDPATKCDRIVPDSIPQPFLSIARECLHPQPGRRCSLDGIRARLNPPLPVLAAQVVESAPPLSEFRKEIESATPAKSRKLVFAAAAFVVIAAGALFVVRSHKSPTSTPSNVQRSVVATDSLQGQAGTVKGEVVERSMPKATPSASASIHGQINVRVRVAVDVSGNISNATFDAQGPSPYFANLAMEAARRWRFKPAQVDGHAVPSAWTLKFQFRRTRTDVAALETSP
jgi:TonB family protein